MYPPFNSSNLSSIKSPDETPLPVFPGQSEKLSPCYWPFSWLGGRGGARLIVDLGDDLLGCCKCLSHGSEGRHLQGVCTCVLPEIHTHTHFPFPCVIPSLSAVFSGAFVGDVKAVIGQVSGVELSDNRLVTAAAHE